MSDLYRVFTEDADLPDDGLLAVEMRNPNDKPRIRLVPVTIDYEAANEMLGRFITLGLPPSKTPGQHIVDAAVSPTGDTE